eukprot:365964-Chlamydomonas_euryale.AAC.11
MRQAAYPMSKCERDMWQPELRSGGGAFTGAASAIGLAERSQGCICPAYWKWRRRSKAEARLEGFESLEKELPAGQLDRRAGCLTVANINYMLAVSSPSGRVHKRSARTHRPCLHGPLAKPHTPSSPHRAAGQRQPAAAYPRQLALSVAAAQRRRALPHRQGYGVQVQGHGAHRPGHLSSGIPCAPHPRLPAPSPVTCPCDEAPTAASSPPLPQPLRAWPPFSDHSSHGPAYGARRTGGLCKGAAQLEAVGRPREVPPV